jgi:hypothetical protein
MTEPVVTPIVFVCMDCLLKVAGGIWDHDGMHCWRCWEAAHPREFCCNADDDNAPHAHLGQEVA